MYTEGIPYKELSCGRDTVTVHILADKDYLLHPVSVFLVPVAHESGIGFHKLRQVFSRSGSIPLSGLSELFLRTGLFEKV